MKILPAKVIGAEATFSAVYDDGDVLSQTYTNTPNGYVAEPHDKATLKEAYGEFQAIAAERETQKAAPTEPSVVDARAEYFDPDADFKKLTAKQAETALKAAFPAQEEPAPVEPAPVITEPAVPADGG